MGILSRVSLQAPPALRSALRRILMSRRLIFWLSVESGMCRLRPPRSGSSWTLPGASMILLALEVGHDLEQRGVGRQRGRWRRGGCACRWPAAGGPAARPTGTVGSVASTTARSTTFSSSRTLPGQLCSIRICMASGSKRSSERPCGVQELLVLAAVLVEEVLDQRGMSSLRSRSGGSDDVDDVQPVVEVLAELAFLHQLAQVGVGGREDAHVHLDGLGRAERHELLLLDHAQQLGLRVQARWCRFRRRRWCRGWRSRSSPSATATALVKAPLHVAEQRGFEQVRRQRAAVHRHEHAVRARRVGVDGLGDQFLAGAGFAGDQNVGRGWAPPAPPGRAPAACARSCRRCSGSCSAA